MMNSRKSPKCPKVCPDRNEWCHSTCDRYLVQVAEHEAEKALIQDDKMRRSNWTVGRKRIAAYRHQQALKTLGKK